jgi:hypothetical protein
MRMAVFCVVALCSLVEVYRRFRGACCLHYQGNGATTQKQPSSYSPPWEPQISQIVMFETQHSGGQMKEAREVTAPYSASLP